MSFWLFPKKAFAQAKLKGTVCLLGSSGQPLADCGYTGELTRLRPGEHYSFSLAVEAGNAPLRWRKAWVVIDSAAPCSLPAGSLQPGGKLRLTLDSRDARRLVTEGAHQVTWFFDGKPMHTGSLLITRAMDWAKVFSLPSPAQIAAYQNPKNLRSQYLYGVWKCPVYATFTEYSIDFKAQYAPRGSYFCLGNWHMDPAALGRDTVSTAYGGVQKIHDDATVGIMSFWDIYHKDAAGNTAVLRPRYIYPRAPRKGGEFTGEGEGEQCIVNYRWEADRWYRMHFKCVEWEGSTVVEQWICDLTTTQWTLLTAFALGFSGSAFWGETAFFLENYLPEYGGQLRTLEVCNARIRMAHDGSWKPLTCVYLSASEGYDGSYEFGVDGGKVYMITSGVGGIWYPGGKGRLPGSYTLS